MSEEQEKQESQKTVVAFIAGLLIGGLLVWIFSGNPTDEKTVEGEKESPAASDEATMSEEADEAAEVNAPAATNNSAAAVTAVPLAELPMGDAEVTVDDQPASNTVALDSVTFPTDEGWIGVRSYSNERLGSLLGVARYSKEQGLIPKEIVLQASTTAGNTYAIVFYSDSGDRTFSLTNDVQMGGVAETFMAR